MKERFLLGLCVSALFLVFLFLNFLNINQFINALLSVNILLFFASDLPYTAQSILMGYRLSWAMNKQNAEEKTRWKDGFFAHLLGMLGSDFSIGRIGYLASSLPFEYKLSSNIGVVSTLVVIDVIMKALFAIASAIFFVFWLRLNVNPLLIFFAASIIAGGGVFFTLLTSPKTIKIVERIPLFGEKILPHYIIFRESLKNLRRDFIFLSLFPVAGWVLRGVEWLILGYAVGISLPFITWFMLHPLLTLIRLVPVTMTGLGIFEYALIMFFPDVDSAKLVTFGILDMINNSFVDLLGLISLWKMRKLK